MQRPVLLVLASLLIAGCATQASSPQQTSGVRFSEAERTTITRFYTPAAGRLPSDKAPKQLAKVGDVLDSGQRPNKLPIDLAKLLPDLPQPYTRLSLGADVVLVNRDTHAIVDVIPQVAY